jgi:predicted esterase
MTRHDRHSEGPRQARSPNARQLRRQMLLGAGCWVVALSGLAAAGASQEVPFLTEPPAIDGALDPGLASLPGRPLPAELKSHPANPPVEPTVRLAYGVGFLYLHVEWSAATIVARDRGYQNGDGLVLVLAEPSDDQRPSERFTVLAFSGGAANAASWSRRLVWYENVALAMRPAGDGVRFAERESDGRSSFEILIHWDDVYPLHPLFGDVGINIMLVKAFGDKGQSRYSLVEDGRIDSEQSPRRYQVLRFATPSPGSGVQVALRMDRNISEGDSLRARLVATAATGIVKEVWARVLAGEGERLARVAITLECTPGITRGDLELPTVDLPAGGYRVQWGTADGQGGALGLTVRPRFEPNQLARRIAKLASPVSPGSRTTMEFLLQDLTTRAAAIGPTDVCPLFAIDLRRLLDLVAQSEAGRDALAARTGLLRRAFRSSLDGSLQPYSVFVPNDKSPRRRRPVVVYLHGSGQDDTALRDPARWLGGSGAVLVAPYARGTSHAYCPKEAQADIADAIGDAVTTYGADQSAVVLTGFSMGGYGVLRTFFESPGRFVGLAIFSGQGDMGPRYGFPEAPDFLHVASLEVLRNCPVFMFHGARDQNCPYEEARRLAGRIEAAGARLTFVADPELGHEAPSPAAKEAYRVWLLGLLASTHK